MKQRSCSGPIPLVVVFYGDPDRYPPTFNAVNLLREHFRVTVVCRNDAGPRSVAWPSDVLVERIGSARTDSAAARLREYVTFVNAVRQITSREAPPVVYAYEPHALVAAAIAGVGTKIVYQRHEVEELDRISWRSMQGWILRASLRLTKRATLVVFPERERAAYYLRFARDTRPPLIVPNFPLLATFPPPSSLDDMVESRLREKVVFYRGAMSIDNGTLDVIRALAHLPTDVSVRLCGTSAPAFVEEITTLAAKLSVGSRVRYEGFIPSFDALNRETLRATVGVLPYHAVHTNWEHVASATNKLYEYAACALPVVVPDRRSFREFLAGESWIEYVDFGNPAQVSAAIHRLLSDESAYAERCRAARRAFEQRLNYETVFAPLLQRIRDLSVR